MKNHTIILQFRSRFLWLILTFFIVSVMSLQAQTQQLYLDSAYIMLEARYPQLKDRTLLHQINNLEQKNIEKTKLPEISLKGEGRLQSEVPSIDVPEGVNFPLNLDLPLYAAKSYVELQYNILDGGIREAQKEIMQLQYEADLQKLDIDQYSLRERVNQHFIKIIILREQNNLMKLLLKDINNKKEIVSSGVEEGVILESELLKIEVKELELITQQDNYVLQLNGIIKSLSNLLGTELQHDVALIFPSFNSLGSIPVIDRPEQEQLKLKRAALLAHDKMINAVRKPKLGVFAQAGVGLPNPLNLFDAGASPYAIAGIQFNWKITDWNKSKVDKEVLQLQAVRLDNARETFEFNLQSKEALYLTEESRILNQLSKDFVIINLQSKISKQISAQLDEGVITSSEYITQLNTELASKQQHVLHQTELLKLRLDFWNERGGKQ